MTKTFKGIPASPGVVKGRIKWLLKVSDIALLDDGEVLAARMTSPDWVSAFETASAIVTEQGGALCHAAVVARERGIPAVVGIGRDLRQLKNGEMVQVDGNSGTVSLIE